MRLRDWWALRLEGKRVLDDTLIITRLAYTLTGLLAKLTVESGESSRPGWASSFQASEW